MTDLPKDFAGLPMGQPEEVALSPQGLDRLVAAFEREIAAGKAAGASFLIARRGRVGFVRTLGFLKPGGPEMPADALFRIYSMTKPITSIAAMQLVEEGRLLLNEPVSKYIPAFADMKVGVEAEGDLKMVPAKRPIMVQDLMRHTSGLTYGFTGSSAVQKLTLKARLIEEGRTNAEFADAAAALPLMHQPGEVWEYSVSTDVLGRVIEVIEGAPLADVFKARVFEPLGMSDTAFFTPPEKLARRAEAPDWGVLERIGISLNNATAMPKLQYGGGGLISSLIDYARFLAMLAGGGALEGKRILGPATLRFMASDHLAPNVRRDHYLLMPGHGFGLGFAVRVAEGLAPTAGTLSEFHWGGVAGTAFFVSPRDELFALMMVQAPEQREYFRLMFRSLVYAAVV